jgi:hypothetical protein
LKTNDAVFHLMDALRAPVLTHAGMWKDCIPDRLLQVISLERLVMLITKQEIAGDAECVAFIMTRTMESPMTHDWAEIYMHLACKVCCHHWQEDHWEELKAQRELTDYQDKYLLLPLRQWIYKKRREHLKKSIRTEELEDNSYKAEDIFTIIEKKAEHEKEKQLSVGL